MPRKYDSSRREATAARTRQSIVEAAVRMHARGTTTISAVAEEAGVSVPTVNKYFPTREDLFDACTRHVLDSLTPPDPAELSAIVDLGERVYETVRQLFEIHEETLGVSWTGYRLEDESPANAEAMLEYEELVAVIVAALLHDWHDDTPPAVEMRLFVQALLGPLAYRALRVKNDLTFEQAVESTALVLARALHVELST